MFCLALGDTAGEMTASRPEPIVHLDPLAGDQEWPLTRVWERCVTSGHSWPMGVGCPESVRVGPCYVWFCVGREATWRVYRFDPVAGCVERVERGVYFDRCAAVRRCAQEAAGSDLDYGL